MPVVAHAVWLCLHEWTTMISISAKISSLHSTISWSSAIYLLENRNTLTNKWTSLFIISKFLKFIFRKASLLTGDAATQVIWHIISKLRIRSINHLIFQKIHLFLSYLKCILTNMNNWTWKMRKWKLHILITYILLIMLRSTKINYSTHTHKLLKKEIMNRLIIYLVLKDTLAKITS